MTLVKQVGCERSFAGFNNTNSKWNKPYSNVKSAGAGGDDFVRVNGMIPVIAGQNILNANGADGKLFVHEFINKCEGNGYSGHAYKWMDTKTNIVQTRVFTVEAYDCGAPYSMVDI